MKRCSGDRMVATGCPHQQVTAGGQIRRRKDPRARFPWMIAERPAGEIDCIRTDVPQFNPVIEGFCIGLERARVGRHELGEDHRIGRAGTRTPHRQRAQHTQPNFGKHPGHEPFVYQLGLIWARRLRFNSCKLSGRNDAMHLLRAVMSLQMLMALFVFICRSAEAGPVNEFLTDSYTRRLLTQLAETNGAAKVERLCRGSKSVAFDRTRQVIGMLDRSDPRTVSFVFYCSTNVVALQRTNKRWVGNAFLTHPFGYDSATNPAAFVEIQQASRRGEPASTFLIEEQGGTNYLKLTFQLKGASLLAVAWAKVSRKEAAALAGEARWPKHWVLPRE